MESLELDRIDRRMLAVLQEDGRIPNSALARRVGLSESATRVAFGASRTAASSMATCCW